MKFITESELRDIYRIHPFTTYEVEPGSRLTPGARQFLSDRGIKPCEEASKPGGAVKGHYYSESTDELKTAAQRIKEQLEEEDTVKSDRPPVITIQGESPVPIGSVRKKQIEEAKKEREEKAGEGRKADEAAEAAESPEEVAEAAPAPAGGAFKPCDDKMLLLRFKTVKAEFLMAGQEMLSLNVLLDQSLMTLCEQLTLVGKALKQGTALPQDLDPEAGGAATVAELSAEKKDPFEVSSFHMQLPNGKEILLLNKVRCYVQLLAEEVNEKATEDRKEYLAVSARLNQIINTLSHLISKEVGGK